MSLSSSTNASRVGLLVIASVLAACGGTSDPSGNAAAKSSVSGDGDAAANVSTNGGSSNGTSDAGASGGASSTGDDDASAGTSTGDDSGVTSVTMDGGGAALGDAGMAADAAVDAGSASLVGTWVPASSADLTAATFTSLTLQADGIWYESGQAFDGTPSVGLYMAPTSIPVGSDYGAPPAGLTGPYLQLTDNSKGDGQWDYGAIRESADGTTLTMTLFAARAGMGLRWKSTPATVHLVRNDAAIPPLGTWKPATTTDQTNAGFATVTISGGGAWVETGRTDGDTDSQGMYAEPLSVPITDASYGNPPAGMHGPYLELAETGDNDGDWIYGFVEAADGSTLTLNLYARSLGMGLRWANPSITINLVPGN